MAIIKFEYEKKHYFISFIFLTCVYDKLLKLIPVNINFRNLKKKICIVIYMKSVYKILQDRNKSCTLFFTLNSK